MRVVLIFLIYFLAVTHLVWTEESESEREEDKNEKTENAIEKPVNEIENEVQETESEREQTENEEEEIEKESDNEVIEKEDVGDMEDGFSFHRYNGPVSGKVRKVVVPNTNPQRQGSTSVDYVGKPDYSFGYGVHDDKSKTSHLHVESRDGNAVHGEYRVLQPDGLVRIVRYSAHPTTGFQAHVSYTKY
ncbi:unnamed protein product [Psylliodes chrysocephalus]|uniref:Uncharacterized protein n=1 Tax=Psylliodes chrysocephalus TaxID=3402493 RepID=A0A9P0CSD9_9CUCU|nr:unnamed protein product [Psylliodes chrysocephala]